MTVRVLALDHVGVLGGAELSMLDVVAGLGADVSVRLFADGPFREALSQRGIDVKVLPMGALAGVQKGSIIPSPRALMAAWRLAVSVQAEANGAQVLYANSQKAFIVASLAARRLRCPVVWHLRDLLGLPHFSALNTRGVVFLANWCAARVITNSAATADAFVSAGGRRSIVRVVHNGIDPAPFDAVTDAQSSALRASIAPEAGQLLAVFGRFHPWKGQHVAIEALSRLPEDSHLLLVGAPLFGEFAYAAQLREQVDRLGLSARVHFLGFRDDVAQLMRAVDVIVHASTLPEPFGRVVVEGMLAGRPVIATAAGGIGEIVTDGVTGLLVPRGDARALASAAAALRADPVRARAMAQAGAAHARTSFGVAAMVRGVRAVLDEVAHRCA